MINEGILDFGESDKMIKIRGKVDKPNYYDEFSSNISFFIQELLLLHFSNWGNRWNNGDNVKRYKRRERVKRQETDENILVKTMTVFSLNATILIGRFFFLFPFRYSIIVNVFKETGYSWTLCSEIPPLHFHFLFLKTSALLLFLSLIESSPPLSGQKSDETWYTWWYLAMTIYPDCHSQNQ